MGKEKVASQNYPKDRQLKKGQVLDKRTYYNEMNNYITSERTRAASARDTTNDVVVQNDYVNDLNRIIGSLQL